MRGQGGLGIKSTGGVESSVGARRIMTQAGRTGPVRKCSRRFPDRAQVSQPPPVRLLGHIDTSSARTTERRAPTDIQSDQAAQANDDARPSVARHQFRRPAPAQAQVAVPGPATCFFRHLPAFVQTCCQSAPSVDSWSSRAAITRLPRADDDSFDSFRRPRLPVSPDHSTLGPTRLPASPLLHPSGIPPTSSQTRRALGSDTALA
jgi:hypothetical protein